MTLSTLPEIEVLQLPFVGHTLAEYSRFFSLEVAALRGRAVLDVGAGPASFSAEAGRRGVDAVAVDPHYGGTTVELAARVQHDHHQLDTRSGRLRCRAFPSTAAAVTDRQVAAGRFLADYEPGFVRNRYVGAALPQLPFFDGAFDLVLCAHLLFLDARQYDFAWHVAAGRELARVSAGEARIHPVCGADGRPYPRLAALRRELAAGGIISRVVRLDGEFFIGSGTMLVLKREATKP